MTVLPHNQSAFFTTQRYKASVLQCFTTELSNDGADTTGAHFISESEIKNAYIIAKQSGIVSGQGEGEIFMNTFFPNLNHIWKKQDRDSIQEGETLIEFSGNAREILKLERVLLNLLSRMSGIATQTNILTKECSTAIAATRKTQWSYLDKKAVHIGGGYTHRIGLFDAMMIKENHILSVDGGLETILNSWDSISPSIKFLEIETENEEEFLKTFNTFYDSLNTSTPKVIMFDNFDPEVISDIVNSLPSKKERHEKNIFLEISGGITKDNIDKYDNCGADVISLGSLTHTAIPLDYSMRFEK